MKLFVTTVILLVIMLVVVWQLILLSGKPAGPITFETPREEINRVINHE